MTGEQSNALARLHALEERIPTCMRCPELRAYCRSIAKEKRRAYAEWDYWAKPVPGFGDRAARILIVGLAPAAHGANRTGRMFTGDRSGDFLYSGLYRAGMANQEVSEHRDDGLHLHGVYISAALRCAPPGNRPSRSQLEACRPYLIEEIRILSPRVILALGRIGWDQALIAIGESGVGTPKPRPRFSHGGRVELDRWTLIGCYHVSQQNTFTGVLTPPMLDAVLGQAKSVAGL